MTDDSDLNIPSKISDSPYRSSRGCTLQTFRDLQFAQGWTDIVSIDLPSVGRMAFKGKRPTSEGFSIAVPCNLNESLSPEWLSFAFKDLISEEAFYLSISDTESTIVYYKISKGLLRPQL